MYVGPVGQQGAAAAGRQQLGAAEAEHADVAPRPGPPALHHRPRRLGRVLDHGDVPRRRPAPSTPAWGPARRAGARRSPPAPPGRALPPANPGRGSSRPAPRPPAPAGRRPRGPRGNCRGSRRRPAPPRRRGRPSGRAGPIRRPACRWSRRRRRRRRASSARRFSSRSTPPPWYLPQEPSRQAACSASPTASSAGGQSGGPCGRIGVPPRRAGRSAAFMSDSPGSHALRGNTRRDALRRVISFDGTQRVPTRAPTQSVGARMGQDHRLPMRYSVPLSAPPAGFAGPHHLRRERQPLRRQRVAQHVRRHAVLVGQQAEAVRVHHLLNQRHQWGDIADLINQVGRQQHGVLRAAAGSASRVAASGSRRSRWPAALSAAKRRAVAS